jgi:general stress protein 26
METQSTASESLKKVHDMIEDIRIAMMTTVDGQGNLVSRPMAVAQVDEHNDIWFFTKRSSPKVDQIDQNKQRVNISLSDVDNAEYVSVSGTAHELEDRAKIDELWNPMVKAWFPEGKEDPELTLLKVHIDMAEYWSASDSKMVRLFQQATAAVTGNPPKMGENEKVYN